VADRFDLAGVLLERLKEVSRRPTPSDAFGRAVAAAIAAEPRDRCWKLVSLAASLRAEGDRELALSILDSAIALGAPADVRHAAYTTAIAIHTDLGNLATAEKLARQELAAEVDEYLLRTLARLYWELYEETRLEEYRVAWRRFSDAVDAAAA
jgi:hypothetical protein